MLLVEDRMSKSPITIKRDDSFQTALNLLRQGGVRHLPVLEGKKLVGILTDRDLRQAPLLRLLRYPFMRSNTFSIRSSSGTSW